MSPRDKQVVVEMLRRHEQGELKDTALAPLCDTILRLRERNREYDWKPLTEENQPAQDEAVVLLYMDGGLELVQYDEDYGMSLGDNVMWMQPTAIPSDHPSKGKTE